MREWGKYILAVLVVLGFLCVVGLLGGKAEAGEKARPVAEECKEIGLMGRYATELVYQYQRKEVLHRMKAKFPASAKYAEYILNAVLEPPIMDAREFQKGLEEACVKENTVES